MLTGRSVVISCSNTAPETSSTTRAQTELPLGGAAMNSVSTLAKNRAQLFTLFGLGNLFLARRASRGGTFNTIKPAI